MSDTARIGLLFPGFLFATLALLCLLFPIEVGALIGRTRAVKVGSNYVEANFDAAVDAFREAKKKRGEGTNVTAQDKKNLEDIIGNTRILWVDDHSEQNRNEIETLRALGHRVDLARSNDEAVRLYALRPYQLVISDIARDNFPQQDSDTAQRNQSGIDLLEQLQRIRSIPPLIYYVTEVKRPLSDKGNFPIVNSPTELIRLVQVALQQDEN